MKTIFTIIREIDDEVLFSCGNLADAQEMVLELAKENAYEHFIHCTVDRWGPKQTREEFWRSLEDDIKRFYSSNENPYWKLVDDCGNDFYILDTVLLD